MSEVIIGIDLGTTQSAVAVVDSGFPLLLADLDGVHLFPVQFGIQKRGGLRSAMKRCV